MTNVVPFPTRFSRDWEGIKETLDSTLRNAGANPDMRAAILGRMHLFYNKTQRDWTISFDLPLPGYLTLADNQAIAKAIERAGVEMNNRVHELMNEILLDRLLLEIAIHNAGVTLPDDASQPT